MRGVPEPPRQTGAVAFRPDVEGLRGLAVALVVADHVVGWPAGGFVGVDVFFVISGFVITTGLLREVRATGTVDLAGFAVRRARRILPGAVLTVLVTVGVAWALDHPPRALAVTWDGAASLLMVQNWHLIRAATDYFGDSGAASPLQHFWSLAVEEQFYVLWPWAVLAAAVTTRRWWSRRLSGPADGPRVPPVGAAPERLLGVALVLATLGSFAVACWEAQAKANWSYFSFESRAWELGVGALAAVVAPTVVRRLGARPTSAGVVTVSGVLAVVVAGLVITPDLPFPGPTAAFPVLGAAALVLAGGAAAPWATAVLTNPVARGLGRWSYAVYLWHLPVWSTLHALAPTSRVLAPVFAVGLTLLLAAATSRFVERPFRARGHRPDPPDAGRRSGRRGRSDARQRPRARGGVVVAGVSALVLVCSAAQFTAPGRFTGIDDLPAPGPQQVRPFPSAAALHEAVVAAVDARTWGRTVPDLDRLSAAAGAARTVQRDGCLYDVVGASRAAVAAAAARCTSGDRRAAHTVVVLGDSIAVSWLPGIDAAVGDRGWRVVGIGLESCPAAVVATADAAHRVTFPAACDRAREAALATVARLRPDVVVTSSAAGGYERQPVADRARSWEDGTRTLVERLARGGARVVVLGSPPEGTPVSACALRTVGPASCRSSPPPSWAPKRAAERRAVLGVPGARFVDTAGWFCDAAGRCPAAVDGIVVRADAGHLTLAYSRALATVLGAVVTG